MCFGSRASSRGTGTLGRPQLRVHIGDYIALVFSVLAAAQEALVPGERSWGSGGHCAVSRHMNGKTTTPSMIDRSSGGLSALGDPHLLE